MTKRRNGFTLVELSIVLVIIGLLVGGVLVGRDLIKNAELKKVYSEYQQFDTAANVYKLKYNALAGDDPRAFNLFGTTCGTNTTDADTGCNGTGDGVIGRGVGGNDTDFGEEPKFFEHLSRAGLIAGSYDGSCVAQESCEYNAGVNVPKSSWSGAVWGLAYGGCEECGNETTMTHNVFMMSGATQTNGSTYSYVSHYANPMLNIQDIWNIDSKYDDGMPNTGRIATWGNDPTDCASDPADITSTYNLTTATEKCTPYFRMSGF